MQRFRTTLDQVPIGLGYMSLDGEWTWANRRFCQIFGYTLEEVLQKTCLEILCPDELEAILESKRQLLAGEVESLALEQRCHRNDASVFWASWTVSLSRGAGGEPKHLVVVVDDISVRKWTEENLRIILAGIEGSSEAIALAGPDGQHAYYNRAFARMFGYEAGEMTETLATIPLCADPAVGRAVLEAIMRGQSWKGEVGMVAKNGRRFPVELRADAIRDEGNQLLGFIGVHTDITERKLAQVALAQSEARFRTLFELAPDGIYLIDLHGKFVDGNQAAEKLIGYGREDLIGKSFLTLNLLLPPDILRAAANLGRNAQGEPTGPEEFTLLPKSGSPVTVEIRTFPVRIGEKSLVLGVARDLTERKQLEGQLRQAQKMEAVGQLAGGVAHDFNNMLAIVRGNADLMLTDGDQLSAAVNDSLKNIVNATERAANLTRQLLVFSSKQRMQAQPLMLNTLISNLSKLLRRTIRENIRLECLYADQLPFVQADPGMLEQVLLNMVVNARDAMPNGGLLQISTEKFNVDAEQAGANSEAEPGEFVCFSVSDTGTGIAPEHLSRLFEPFFTTKEADKGTGLGLATAYGIVKQHKGWIEVNTQIGIGTRFKIFLPAIPPPSPTAGDCEVEANARGGTERILLVEDDFAVLALTGRLLENAGYSVWKAASADEALDLWRTHASEVDLLLTDLVTPGTLTGRDLAVRLHREKPGIKVIFMSGYSPEVAGKTEFFDRLNARFLQKALRLLARSWQRFGTAWTTSVRPKAARP